MGSLTLDKGGIGASWPGRWTFFAAPLWSELFARLSVANGFPLKALLQLKRVDFSLNATVLGDSPG